MRAAPDWQLKAGRDVRRCIGRAVIDDDNLTWSAGLTHYAVKRGGQKFGSIMDCNYNGNHALEGR
jgi:hypothetical protein